MNPNKIEKLIKLAIELGADVAKPIHAEEIVVDERVRLKCEVPLCYGFNRYLTCPPFVMGVEEFKKILRRYRDGLLIQVVAKGVNSLEKSEGEISKELMEKLEENTHSYWMKKLHEIVDTLEKEAFKLGYYLAVGLVGGHCQLCKKCVVESGERICRFPFKARPSMEALGIDIIKTCENAGLSVRLSSEEDVRWTGLLLVE